MNPLMLSEEELRLKAFPHCTHTASLSVDDEACRTRGLSSTQKAFPPHALVGLLSAVNPLVAAESTICG